MEEPYQQRVVNERDLLSEKLNRLNKFIDGSGAIYISLSEIEQRLLHAQRAAMETYHRILCARISLFKETNVS
jgi:hypothetical protein